MKKSLFIALFIVLNLMVGFAQPEPNQRPKVGVVLSGGGAKGFAHIGVLKVLEEAGIPIDYIGGTSIGSIVGAFYAMGYSANEIEILVKSQDWEYLLSDRVDRIYNPYFEKEEQDRYSVSFPITPTGVTLPSSLTKGQNLNKLFSRVAYHYHNTTDFSQLPIPFFCIASDINSGEEVILDSGYLPSCIKASMAVPMAFEPVEIDGRKLIDGGIKNNFPVDVMLEKGVDLIIGVDITDGIDNNKNDKLDMGHMVGQLINFFGHDKYLDNKANCDVFIKPDISGYNAASFTGTAADSLIVRGEQAAMRVLPQLTALKERLGREFIPQESTGFLTGDTVIYIKEIMFHGVENTNMSFIKGKMNIEPGSIIQLSALEEGIDRAYGSKLFDYISYRLEGDDEKILHLDVKEAYSDAYNIGLHYDNVDDASLLLNGTWRNYITGGSRFSLNLKLATNISAYAQYTVDRGVRPGYSIEARYNDVNMTLYDKGDATGNLNVRYSYAGASMHSIFWDRFALGVGTRIEYIDLRNLISQNNDSFEKYLWYNIHRGFVKLDTRDNIYFPKSGFDIDGEVQLITKNGFTFEDEAPPVIVKLKYQHVFSLSKRVTQISQIYGRVYIGENIPIYSRSRLGGHEQLNYFDMMVPFVGLKYGEVESSNVLVGRYDFRYNFYKKHYLTAKFNAALYNDHLDDIHTDGSWIFGGGLSYSTSTFIGPIEVNLMLSDYYNHLNTFISLGYWF